MDVFRTFFKGDKVVWMIYLFFCVISLIEVFSASSTLTYKSGDHWGPITGHVIFMLGGALVVWCVHLMPVSVFNKGVAILPISWILLLIVLGMAAVNNAKRWIDLGFVQFQPSELAKLGIIFMIAKILAITQGEEGADKSAFKYIMWITGITCGLIVTENLTTCLLIASTVFCMMVLGRIPFRQLSRLVLICVGSVALMIAVIQMVPKNTWEKVGLDRMVTWQNRIGRFFEHEEIAPKDYDLDLNAQEAHASIAIVNSGGIGKGPGNSVERDFLSQAFSDFIFAIIIEELGLPGAAIVIFLYILLLRRILRIIKMCDKSFLSFLVAGIGIIITLQALINMCVSVGIIPVTGQPLPLISKGGTSMIITATYIGIILSVSRYVEEQKALSDAGLATETDREEALDNTVQER